MYKRQVTNLLLIQLVLNHLKILEFSCIFSEVITPKNLDEKVAKDVTNIARNTLFDIFFSFFVNE